MAAADALVRLMLGALVPGREGGLLNAACYFDPHGVAPASRDVAALVSGLGDRRTVVTLVNTAEAADGDRERAAGEHQFESVSGMDEPTARARDFTVRLAPAPAPR